MPLKARFPEPIWLDDKQAFVTDIATKHGRRLRRYLAARLRNAVDVSDLVQEVFLRLMRVPQHESIRNPEAYVKGRVNAAMFRSKFDRWQERVTNIYETPYGPLPFAVVTNVAQGIVQGVDFEATIIPTPHIEISAFYTFLDPYFTSNTADGNDYSKTPVAEVVKHKASATVRYLFGLPSSVGDASVSATYSWQSSQVGVLTLNVGPTADPNHGELPAYGVLNVRADWKRILGHPLDLGAFCDNATDKTYLILMNNDWVAGEDIRQYAPPRMFGVSARWHF